LLGENELEEGNREEVIGLRMDRRKICGKNGLKINRRGGGK
jgi:hypothetical protein